MSYTLIGSGVKEVAVTEHDELDPTEAARAQREAEDARREADALRRDRERDERAAQKETERARRDAEKIERTRAKDAEQARRDQEKRDQDAVKAAETARRDQERAERERAKAEENAQRERERSARDAAHEAGRALRDAAKAERAAALAQQRAARQAEKARAEADRAGDGPGPDLAGLPRDLAVLWRAPAPGRRGPRPGLTVEQIADAGIALADTEGIAAVSMARLAESLGFTTMSLYRYVSSKDEVLALMSDRAGGRPPLVGPEVGDWRARLEVLLGEQRPVIAAHPWLAHTTSVLHALGPNRLAWMEAMLAALDDTPLSPADRLAVTGTLAAHMLDEARVASAIAARRAELVDDDVAASPDELVLLLADEQTHPSLVAAARAGAFAAPDDGALPFGTRVILDGIEAMIARA
ncbi:TetR family transcriptional regulator [Cellulomonas rhizosphaerae]|uniref:TetR family transcriptional regulator n=1 Tax=Cellulomonas rhizosphaerae TaxID=2293719 RepID=A0A413RH38_9CELL|nr:TetR family transcriptional regulator [Cellulomonas rhizosphaerae]